MKKTYKRPKNRNMFFKKFRKNLTQLMYPFKYINILKLFIHNFKSFVH